MSFEAIKKDIKSGNYKPVYLLHGEESYYIEQLEEAFIAAVSPEAKAFDCTILYGKDATVDQLIDAAKRYPVMADRQLVMLKEAQMIKKLEQIESLLENPVQTTTLVIAYKGKADARKKWVKTLKKAGVVFVSNPIPSYKMTDWISSEVQKKGLRIDMKSAAMLHEFLGADLSRIMSEIDKLSILTGDQKVITPALIERNIGVSRDYNIFELHDAFLTKNSLKVFKIHRYYGQDPSKHPMPMITASLYGLFTKMILIHAKKAFNSSAAAQALGAKPFYSDKILNGARKYSYRQLVNNIGVLEEYDLKSKGVGSRDESPSELMKEMFFKLLH